jgi:rubrerythrin
MRFEQTKDVLEHARNFHNKIGEFYKKHRDHTEQQRIKLLLDYMSHREQELAGALEQFAEGSSREVLDTWFQFTVDDETLKLCPDALLHDEMTVDDVIRAGVAMSQCFINLFREIATTADSDQVRAVFQNLLESEQREQKKLVRNAEMFMDL